MDMPVVVLTARDLALGALLLVVALAATALLTRRRCGPSDAPAPVPSADATPAAPRTVRSAVEQGIREMASVETWRAALIAEHGELSPEMEELFAAYRRQVKDRRLAQLERELAAMMGMEAER